MIGVPAVAVALAACRECPERQDCQVVPGTGGCALRRSLGRLSRATGDAEIRAALINLQSVRAASTR